MKTLGESYRVEIVGRHDLIIREFPDHSDACRIVKDLFGWKLYSGKHLVECRSEEEARFLKVFFDVRMGEVSVPEDDNYLKAILPELEHLKKRMDEIISVYVDGVLSPKIKIRVKHEVFQELIK
ncbi:MAG: hypothetical protein GY940_02590 [bacterium]|nr:hypothetical protein [bacterium]